MNAQHQSPAVSSILSVADVQRLAATELSTPARVRYVSLLLVALAMAALTGALWLTERDLPARTQVALLVMTAIALSWVGFAAWVLTRRRVLLVRQRIVGAWMGVAFSGIFTLGSLGLGYWGGLGRAAYAAAAVEAVFALAAVALLVRAQRELARLVERRRALAHGTDGRV